MGSQKHLKDHPNPNVLISGNLPNITTRRSINLNQPTPNQPIPNQPTTNPEFLHYSEIYNKKRTKLPLNRKEIKFNVWDILRDAVGKDLSRISMPGILMIFKLIL